MPSLSELTDWLKGQGVGLADLVNSGATPQTQAMTGPADAFRSFANPEAVLNSPVAQTGMGFMPLSVGKAAGPLMSNATEALRGMRERIISGAEGLAGDAKYAALRQIEAKLRELEGQIGGAGANMIPPDMTRMREIMERVNALRLNPMKFKD